MSDEIDLDLLVERGHLSLDRIFADSKWIEISTIATYTLCVYGRDGCQAGELEVALASATEFGITAYRWIASDPCNEAARGPITLSEQDATEDGENFASSEDQPQDEE